MAQINDDKDIVPDIYTRETLVMGCGNPLMGDDGFGPAVVEALEEGYDIPSGVTLESIETSAREILFPMVLADTPVRHIIIIDAVDMADKGHRPGEIFELPLDDIPFLKQDDFSMHQVPSSNLLKELESQRNVKITILACQVESIPDMVCQGLSEPVRAAIPGMCRLVAEHWGS